MLTLSLHMNQEGASCFPSTRTLADETGLSERSVISHLGKAVATAWLTRDIRGLSGQYWKRHEYKARIPLEVMKEVQQLNDKGTETPSAPPPKGAERPSPKVLKEVQHSSSNNSSKKMFDQDSDQIRLSSLLFDLIRKNHPKAKAPNLQQWARDIDLSIRVDGRTPEELEKVIRWCQADNFWRGNILSVYKLRVKFDQLWVKMLQNGRPAPLPLNQDDELRRCL